jgi:hypothetical protein
MEEEFVRFVFSKMLRVYGYRNPIRLLSRLKLRIKITKSQLDRINDGISLSFSIGALNIGFKQDRIVLSYLF